MQLDIWPALPIVIEVRGSNDGMDNDVIAALKHNDCICEIHAKDVPWSHLEKLVELMQAQFPALTHLCFSSRWGTSSNLTAQLPDAFLGGLAPHLRSLNLSNIAFLALPNLLLSATGLLSYLFSTHPPAFSVEVMVDCLSSLICLEKLYIDFERRPLNASCRQPPLTRFVLPMLNSLSLRGPVEHLEDLYTRIEAPLLKHVHIKISDPVILDASTILPFIGHKEAFEALNQAHMAVIDGNVTIILSSQNGTSGDMLLMLSLTSDHDTGWWLQALTQDHRLSPLANFDRLGYLLYRDRDRDEIMSLWVNCGIGIRNTHQLLCFFAFVECLYLSKEVAIQVVPILGRLATEEGGVTEVSPALQGIYIDTMGDWGPDWGAIGRFVFMREVSGYLICVLHRLYSR